MKFPPPFYRWRPHPWHGLEVGPNAPSVVHAYIEITPFDMMKYEVDKATGYLRIDRPQRGSSHPPALYGFIPRTYCDQHLAKLSSTAERGDGDPLDICVVTERPINRSELIVNARVVGGLDVNDGGEADDKIIAVLENDYVWGKAEDISELPSVLVERIRHYFATYKMIPGEPSKLTVERVYGRDHALKVVEAAMKDYYEEYGQ
ncbi:MAG: inorganic pyrophosphatase [Caldilineaceae bacterium]